MRARAWRLLVRASYLLEETLRMNTDLLMHENGLDNAGKLQLPLDELLY